MTELSISVISVLGSGWLPSSAGLGAGGTSWMGWSTMAMHLEISFSDAGGWVDGVFGS